MNINKTSMPKMESKFFADKNIVHGKGNLNKNPSKLDNKPQLTNRSVSVMDNDKIETLNKMENLNIDEVSNENTEKSRKEKFSEFKDLLNEILVKNENSGQKIQNELKKSISSFEKSLSKEFEKKQSREDVENELKKLKGDIENLDKNIGVLDSKLKSLVEKDSKLKSLELKSLEERKHGKIFVILSVVSAIAIAAFGVAGIMGVCIGFGVFLLGFAIAAIVKFKNASSIQETLKNIDMVNRENFGNYDEIVDTRNKMFLEYNKKKEIENDLLNSPDNLSLERAFVEKFGKVEKKLDEIISLIESVRYAIGTFNSIEEEARKAI